MKTFKNSIDEVAEPLSQGEKNFKAAHVVVNNKKLVPGVTDQDHVFNGLARKLDKPTASYEIYKSEDESKENYDKGLKVKQDPYAEEVEIVDEGGKNNWDKVARHHMNDTLGNRMLKKKALPRVGPSKEALRKLATQATHVGAKIKEAHEISDEELNEVLTKKTPASKWIHDFVHSDNPKFAGKSTKERQKMALAAYYAKQNEEVENVEEGILKGTASLVKHIVKVPAKAAGRAAMGAVNAVHSVAGGIKNTVKDVKDASKNVKKAYAEETVTEDVDYDYEGEMAKAELRAICDKADQLADMMSDDQQLEAWLQSKISRAKDYIDAVYDYMMYRDKPAADMPAPTQSSSMASTYGSFLNRMGEETEIEEKELSPKQKKIAKLAGDPENIDAHDLAALRAGKKVAEEVEEIELKSQALRKAFEALDGLK
jgi:hypothetical protein